MCCPLCAGKGRDRARWPKGSAPWALFKPRGPSKVGGKSKASKGSNGLRGEAQRLKESPPWALLWISLPGGELG